MISLFASAKFKSVIPHQRFIYIFYNRTTKTFEITCTPQASTLLPYYFEFNTRHFFFTFFRTENMVLIRYYFSFFESLENIIFHEKYVASLKE